MPTVPAPIKRNYEARVIVRLEAKEYRGELSKGVEYDFWGYNGQVPGPFVRVREGDTIEFHFKHSKSAKNYVPPEKILNEMGADLLRLWVAAEDYRNDIRVSTEI
ncbi:MAG: class I tRNA ligase family protein, partial [Thermodesulfobacteriota bacterium]